MSISSRTWKSGGQVVSVITFVTVVNNIKDNSKLHSSFQTDTASVEIIYVAISMMKIRMKNYEDIDLYVADPEINISASSKSN